MIKIYIFWFATIFGTYLLKSRFKNSELIFSPLCLEGGVEKLNVLDGILCPVTFQAQNTSHECTLSSVMLAPDSPRLDCSQEKKIIFSKYDPKTLAGRNRRSQKSLHVLIQDGRLKKTNPDKWNLGCWLSLLCVGAISWAFRIGFQTARNDGDNDVVWAWRPAPVKMVLPEPTCLWSGSAQCAIKQRKN